MAAYLVLARKYRSATFDEVVGQEHVAQTLKNAIASGRIAHAYLFVGTRGVGKTTMARILAKALNCLKADAPTAQPCNQCDACVAIARGDDLDVVEIDGASNRRIEEIRELRSNVIYRPARSRYKIYYIDEVHMLTREAFNALLKTLEEPPGHVKFIFATTEAEKLPATIVSRCQRFDFRDIPVRKIAAHLQAVCQAEKVQVEEGAIFRIARAAGGSMRDGLSVLDQLLAAGEGQVREEDVLRVLGTPPEEQTAAIVDAIAGNDPAGALAGLDRLLAGGLTLESAVGAIGDMFRHMMLIAACGQKSDLVELPESQLKAVAELTGKFTLPVLVQAVSLCQTTARGLRGLTGARALVEATVVRLASADKFVDAASLLDRLERLGAATSGAGGLGGGARSYPPRPAGYPAPSSGLDQKKKALTPAGDEPGPDEPNGDFDSPDQSGPSAFQGQSTAGAAPAPSEARLTISWDLGEIQGRWPELMAWLVRQRQGLLSGLLAPAKVLAVEGDTLRLGFEAAHEPLRTRAEGMDDKISSALGCAFNRPVKCRYVGTSQQEAPTAPKTRVPIPATLSTAERTEINGDPAVRAVLDLFNGSVADIRRAEPPRDAASGDEPATR